MCEKNALTDEEANDITYRLRKLTKLSERLPAADSRQRGSKSISV